MNNLTNYYGTRILNHLFRKEVYAPPTIYIGLWSGAFYELNGNGYVRKRTTVSDWSIASNSSITNVNNIVFKMATGYWGKITHFALFDAKVGGNILTYGPINNAEFTIVDTLNSVIFEAGDIKVKIN